MRKYYVETAKSVSDFKDGFEEARNYIPREQIFRSELKDDLRTHGLNPSRSRDFKLVSNDGLVEFDSSNISHAGAIYGATFEGPDGIVSILEKEME